MMQVEQFEVNYEHELRHWWFVGRRRILRAVVAAVLPPSRDTLIVDVGCGTGGNLAAFDSLYACVGIDPATEAIGLARSRFPEMRFIHGTAPEDLGADAGRADLFVLGDVLEHVEDDRGLLSALVGVARDGARLLITVPADMTLWSKHDESHGHFRRYDARQLAALWEHLPVEVELLSYFNTRLYPLVKMIRRRNQRRGTSSGAADTDVWTPRWPVNTMLTRMFAGERRRLLKTLRGRARGYRRGVSLIALLRKCDRRRPLGEPTERGTASHE